MTLNATLNLQNFNFADLRHAAGLLQLDRAFLEKLAQEAPLLHDRLLAYRAEQPMSAQEVSELLLDCARSLEAFIATLFAIEEPLAMSQAKTTAHNPLATFKKYFVLRRAKKELNKAEHYPPFATLHQWLLNELKDAPLHTEDLELAVGLLGAHYLAHPDRYGDAIETLVQWCVQAIATHEGQQLVGRWVSFKLPSRVDHQQLVPYTTVANDDCGRVAADAASWRHRDGFKLTDPRMHARAVQNEVNYCIYCHDHDGDFCAKGFPVKKGDPTQGFKHDPLGVTLTGCPLEEKISEMHLLKRDGHTIGALAMIMVDNPMCPATGHRICNDCMKACIYQKQDPVNIPQIETRVLTDVLDLPWGVEVYDLLTRWNPLRQSQWCMKPYNGLKVMIAGMGPAGFTLAHHLLLEGFAVVGFDGLKIEPLPDALIHQPIKHFSDLREALDERLMAGFGGVAEYGITVRWDKNFLKLIYISLMRRPYFQVFGGVRFGGTITVEDAWQMGFDHFVVAVGAGLPKALAIPGSLAPGMRQANDFLMALQLGNAAKTTSLTNLQIRLPAVVIGGGLTGVDTATELQAYYITLVEKVLMRYDALIAVHGEEHLHAQLDPASREILSEYLAHGRAVRKERERAATQNMQPNFLKLIHEWGGVTIAYRRSMQESPAYVHNHEELRKALEEGIYYIEAVEPSAIDLNKFGHTEALVCHKRIRDSEKGWVTTQEEVRLAARSILVATGTQPNTAYEFEHRGTFNRVNLQYQHYEEENGELTVAHGVAHCKDPAFGPFTSHRHDHRRVSLIGDTHPVFHGSVVKAIASGMRTYPKIVSVLKDQMKLHGDENAYQEFAEHMSYLFRAEVVSITRQTPQVLELCIAAPLAAKHFKAGQFYRLQNFETLAPKVADTLLQMEPLALVAAECDPVQGTLTFIIHEHSAAQTLCSILQPGEPVTLMGPTGVRAKIPTEHETVLIVGDTSSFAFVRSYGPELRAAGNRVLYAGEFNDAAEIYCQEALENATDQIIWQTKDAAVMTTQRAHDLSLIGDDIITTLVDYATTSAVPSAISLRDIDRVFVVGNSQLLRRFQQARSGALKEHFIKDPIVTGSVYGNMQCMLKGVCAQCLQWQIDPETGQRTKAVFACSWQDQPLEIIDIDHMAARQMQNCLLDQLNKLWIDHVLVKHPITRL